MKKQTFRKLLKEIKKQDTLTEEYIDKQCLRISKAENKDKVLYIARNSMKAIHKDNLFLMNKILEELTNKNEKRTSEKI